MTIDYIGSSYSKDLYRSAIDINFATINSKQGPLNTIKEGRYTRHRISMKTTRFIAISTLLALATLAQTIQESDKCECYCCPGSSNPYGVQQSCNTTTPPLVGAIPISTLSLQSLITY